MTLLGYVRVTGQTFFVDYVLAFISFRLPLFVLTLQLTFRLVNQRRNTQELNSKNWFRPKK
jgi:hypothetical protein